MMRICGRGRDASQPHNAQRILKHGTQTQKSPLAQYDVVMDARNGLDLVGARMSDERLCCMMTLTEAVVES